MQLMQPYEHCMSARGQRQLEAFAAPHLEQHKHKTQDELSCGVPKAPQRTQR